MLVCRRPSHAWKSKQPFAATFCGAIAASVLSACGGGAAPQESTPPPPDNSALRNLFDVPVADVGASWVSRFNRGDALFQLVLRDSDGLGPLYTRQFCGACHDDADGLRGPGYAQKMSVVEADGLTPSPDQSALPFGHTVHPYVTAGATTPIVPPANPAVRLTNRLGPSILGRGYLEAVEDSEIQRVAALQAARGDGIHGR